jgi:hypothetical protein
MVSQQGRGGGYGQRNSKRGDIKMKKELALEIKKQRKDAKVKGLIAKYQERVDVLSSGLEQSVKDLPSLYARVVLKEIPASKRDQVETKVAKLKEQKRKASLTLEGLRSIERGGKNDQANIEDLKEDRERYEQLKGLIGRGEKIRPMWEREIKTYGESKAKRVLQDYLPEICHLVRIKNYVVEMSLISKRLDDDQDFREFISSTTGKTVDAILEG